MALPTALQTVALAQLDGQFWSLVESMHDYFAANPTASAATALAHLEGLADPAPTDDVKIVDRTALFNWMADRVHPYEGKANAYLSLRQLLLDQPKAFVRLLDKDGGRSIKSRVDSWAQRITSPMAYQYAPPAVNPVRTVVRDPAKGNFIVSESWTATVDGVSRSISRTFDVVLTGGKWVSTPSEWTGA